MFCSSCGTKLPDDSKYCYKCGTKLIRPVTDDIKNDQSAGTLSIDQYQPGKTEKTITNTRKFLGIVIIILGVFIALAGGYAADYISNAAKPIEIQSGYIDNGELIIYDSGTVGGDTEAVSYYNNLKYFIIIFGVASAITGIAVFASGIQFESAKSIKKRGQVIDVDIMIVTIEFTDGSRERLRFNSNSIVLVLGDFGDFEIKEKVVVGFERIKMA